MSTERYNPRVVEPRWQSVWAERRLFETPTEDPRPKYYVLEMFPYPSGRIHMGHVRNYAMGDVLARYRAGARLQRAASDGLGRLRPAGGERRDAEQGPSEGLDLRQHRGDARAAEDRWACRSTGAASSPPATSILRGAAALFLDFLDAGLVARKTAKVNWDPVDQTVLANEQVIDGRGWRSGAEVEQRELTQWFLTITAYSEELLEALKRSTAGPTRFG